MALLEEHKDGFEADIRVTFPGPFCRYGLTTAANDPGLDSVGRGICRICHVDKKPCLHVPVELIGVGRVLTAAIGHLRGLQHIGMSMGVPNGADWDRTVIEQFGRLKEVYHRAAMVF